MNWGEAIKTLSPHVVKIETPTGYGTGFLAFYNLPQNWCGIATAAHVVSHAEEWQQPIRIRNEASTAPKFLQAAERVIYLDRPNDSAVVLFLKGELQLPESPIALLPMDEPCSTWHLSTPTCQPGPGRVNELTLGNRFGVPMVILHSLLGLLSTVLYLYFWVIIAAVILSWLLALNAVNRHNDFVRSIWKLVTVLTEPLLAPIRGMIPNLGGIDISPVILLLLIGFLKSLIDGYNESIGF